MRIPISIKLIIYFFILSVTSIFIVGKFSSIKNQEALINRTFDQLISIRIEKEKRVIDFFNQSYIDLNYISELNDIKFLLENLQTNNSDTVYNNQFLSDFLYGYLKASDRYEKIILINTSNEFFVDNLNSSNKNDTLTSNEKEDLDIFFEELINSDTLILKETGKFVHTIKIGKKVLTADSNLLGVLILELSYNSINEIMYENNIHNGLGETGEVYLVGGDYLMRSSSRFISNSAFETTVKTEGVINSLNNLPGKAIIYDYRGIRVFSSYKKLDIYGLDWVILAEIDEFEAMQSIKNIENNILYMSIIISLLLIGVIAAISSNITSPIRKLQAETERIAKGEYGRIINMKFNDEIGDLINEFNQMSLQLEIQANKLEYEKTIRSSFIIDGQEAERQRLSRELHDGLAQYILAIKMKLEHALSSKGEKRNILIEETKQLFSQTIKEIRNISNNLMPSVLKEYGLKQALKVFAEDVNNDAEIKLILTENLTDNILNQKAEIYIYRIIQEAFNNTIKHAKATELKIEISNNLSTIFLNISDNGIGYNSKGDCTFKGNGLANIKERVNLLSGKTEIITAPNKAFLLKISIPI